MTDKHLHSETNQEKEGMPEEYVQPPMAEQGQENPVQQPIVEQDQQKSVPTSAILTLAYYLALGYLGFVLCGAIAVGPWVFCTYLTYCLIWFVLFLQPSYYGMGKTREIKQLYMQRQFFILLL